MRQGRGLFSGMKDQRSLADIAVKKLQETNRSLILTEMAGAGEDRETFLLNTYMRGIGAEALVPLLFQGRLQGALVLGAKVSGETFGQSDVGFLETLAAHAASALENARLNDITRKVRSSLQESEERFTTLAQRMPAAVFIHRGASIVYANSAAEEMTGYPQEQLMTMHIRDMILPEYRGAIRPNGLEADRAAAAYAEKEVRVLRLNGNERWAIMTSAVIEYGERAAVIWIFFDITEHKRNEARLRYERIRDAVGRMATYFAGDLEGHGEGHPSCHGTSEHGRRRRSSLRTGSEDHVHDAAGGDPGPHPEGNQHAPRDEADPSGHQRIRRKRQQILAAMLSGKCELVMRSSPEPLKVMADPIKLESALMNLVVNARDQMPRGGVVTVATGRALIDADFIRRTGYGRIGTYATITVSDTGEGMGAAEQERIFEPFYHRTGRLEGKRDRPVNGVRHNQGA